MAYLPVEAVAVGIDTDKGFEVFNFELPHGFSSAEIVEEEDLAYGGDTACQRGGGTAGGLKVDAAIFAAGNHGLGTHAAFADDKAESVTGDNSGHVGVFAAGGGGAGSDNVPGVGLWHHDGAAVVDGCVEEGDGRGGALTECGVEAVATGEDGAIYGDGIASFEGEDLPFIERAVE